MSTTQSRHEEKGEGRNATACLYSFPGRVPPPASSQMSWGGMKTAQFFMAPDRLGNGSVHFQRFDCCPARGAESDHPDIMPAEMQPPEISSWIEKGDPLSCLGVGRFSTRPFSQRARDAGQRKIVGRSRPAGNHRQDVIDVKGGLLSVLRDAAILATVLRAVDNLMPQVFRNGHEITPRGSWHAANGGAEAKAGRPVQPDRSLRGVRSESGECPDPACRAGREGVARPLWAAAVGRDRRATQSQVERAFACSDHSFLQHATRRGKTCPSLKHNR
jgi:hypothetical protein